MSAFVNVLAMIGILFLIYSFIRYLVHAFSKRRDRNMAMKQNPPSEYMQTTGSQCADYIVNTGVDKNGNTMCKNLFHIKMNPNGVCNQEVIKFSPIPSGYTFEYGNPDGLTTLSYEDKYNFYNSKGSGDISRCDYLNQCGPNPNVQAVWSGVSEVCNNPPKSTNPSL